MKRRNIIGVIATSTFLLLGGLVSFILPKESSVIQAEAWNTNQTPSVQSTYYSKAEGLSGSALKDMLGTFNTPTNKSYTWSRYEAADEAQDDSSAILCIYTRHNIPKSNHVSSGYAWDKWNREHVFTQTAFPSSADDNHNIFACEGKINQERGDKKYAEGGNTVSVHGYTTGCKQTGSTFEPCDEAKGEIARACMYVTLYYPYALSDIFVDVATCLKWHSEHPVTAREIYRNNAVYKLQGNRNPFVDHPSYANSIYGATYSQPDPLEGGQAGDPVSVTGVTLNKTEVTLQQGNATILTATITPSDATNKNIIWSSSNTSVATVNNGKVTAIFAGTANITAKTSDGGFTATCKVTVTPADPTPTENVTISFNANGGVGTMANVEVEKGQRYTLPECGFTSNNGATFVGWKVYGNVQKPGEKIIVNSNLELVAQWEGGTDVPVTPDQPSKKKGCGGSIIAASSLISFVSLIGVGFLYIKKKQDK